MYVILSFQFSSIFQIKLDSIPISGTNKWSGLNLVVPFTLFTGKQKSSASKVKSQCQNLFKVGNHNRLELFFTKKQMSPPLRNKKNQNIT